MSRTLSGKTTGMAAQIEKADFLDSITPRQPLTKDERAKILKEILAGLERNANEYPEFADGLLAKAKEMQLEIDNLSADVPSGWEDNRTQADIDEPARQEKQCICCDYLNFNPDPVPNPDCPLHGSLNRREIKAQEADAKDWQDQVTELRGG